MNSFDIFAVACLVLFLCFGLWRGAARQIISFLGLLAGAFLALKYHQPLSGFIPFGSITFRLALAFALIAASVIFAAYVVAWFVSKLASAIGMGWLNRAGGGVISLLKAVVVIAVAGVILVEALPTENQTLRTSKVLPYVSRLSRAAADLIPDEARGSIKNKISELENYWQSR